MVTRCPMCGDPMRPLLTSWFCPNDCDRRGGPPVRYIDIVEPRWRYKRAHLSVGPSGAGDLTLGWSVDKNLQWNWSMQVHASRHGRHVLPGDRRHEFQLARQPVLGVDSWLLYARYRDRLTKTPEWSYTGLRVPYDGGRMSSGDWSDVFLAEAP